MKKILSFIIILVLIIGLFPSMSYSDYSQIEDFPVKIVVNNKEYTGSAINASYRYNTYLSLRSLAEAFEDTEKEFNFTYSYTDADGAFFEIENGQSYEKVEKVNETNNGNDNDEAVFLSLAANRLFEDGTERKYYTYRYGDPEDLYMSLTDIQLLFNIGAEFTGSNEITFHLDRTFTASVEGLESEGYFEQFNSVLSGNSKDGKILFATNEKVSYPIASTSKLMSYLIIADAISDKSISLQDEVKISSNVQYLSKSEDGRIKMEEGKSVPLTELLEAMLVVSSNEAALACAEHVAGSETAFVKMMNDKASELGLTASKFYNCSGLPVMTVGSIPTKLQNKMSSEDMFILVSHILKTHPEITDITSKQLVKLETLDYTSWNSNSLVFNDDTITGLKTGSTNASGSCVVSCDNNGKVVIIFGAEDSAIRGRTAQILFHIT